MITAVQTKERFQVDPRWWKVALMDFVDDFRRNKDPKAVADSFCLGDEQKDAVLAGAIETLCVELGIEIPDWLGLVPACRQPYFVAGLEGLKALALVQSPAHFRVRKVFVLDNFLSRV
jgi:hypothetical protein